MAADPLETNEARKQNEPDRIRLKHQDSTVPRFDRLIHEQVRLGILSALAVNPQLSFAELKGILKASDGNLSVHARKLENAGYILCEKRFENRLPKTIFSLTKRGRQELDRYLDHMEALIRATRQ
jgi:DNA-binding MarR family transcriptional regulator